MTPSGGGFNQPGGHLLDDPRGARPALRTLFRVELYRVHNRARRVRFPLPRVSFKLPAMARMPTTRSSRLRKPGVIVLDAAYLHAIDQLESLPENRSGADKTWVERALRAWREHYARAVRARRSVGEGERGKEPPKRKGSRSGSKRPPR